MIDQTNLRPGEACADPDECQSGQFIRTNQGRIVMLDRRTRQGWIVKSGAAGPMWEVYSWTFQWATEQEIREAGLWGVGFAPSPRAGA